MTYTDHDADFHQEPWLVSPAPIPMYGTDLLVELSESVGLALMTGQRRQTIACRIFIILCGTCSDYCGP